MRTLSDYLQKTAAEESAWNRYAAAANRGLNSAGEWAGDTARYVGDELSATKAELQPKLTALAQTTGDYFSRKFSPQPRRIVKASPGPISQQFAPPSTAELNREISRSKAGDTPTAKEEAAGASLPNRGGAPSTAIQSLDTARAAVAQDKADTPSGKIQSLPEDKPAGLKGFDEFMSTLRPGGKIGAGDSYGRYANKYNAYLREQGVKKPGITTRALAKRFGNKQMLAGWTLDMTGNRSMRGQNGKTPTKAVTRSLPASAFDVQKKKKAPRKLSAVIDGKPLTAGPPIMDGGPPSRSHGTYQMKADPTAASEKSLTL